jgi:transcription antitermination factor NusG
MLQPTPSWFVLRVAPQRELAAAARLDALGLASYVPLRRAWRTTWLRRDRRRVDEVGAPLLPGYAFLGATVGNWLTVLGTDDVTGLLMAAAGGAWSPAVVADAELAELRKAARRAPIAAGDLVEVEAGPFAGNAVKVLSVDELRKNIGAEVVMLGAARQVRLSVDVLAAA